MILYFMAAPGIIAFDAFELDTGRRELRRDGVAVDIEPQVLDLITHLAANAGAVVTKDDLIEHVWGGRIVSDSAISSRINAARVALDDNGSTQKFIKTIPRRGFRFEAAVSAPKTSSPAPKFPDKPSVAVLPFQNMSGEPEQSYFSDGITDDIITELSRYDELFVIDRHSAFAYRDHATATAEIAGDLGVQYIVEGGVRRAGNRIRVTVRLIDPWAKQQLWAERYDRDLADIFEVQDEISSVIVNTLAGQIARQHYKRSYAITPDAVNAYDHVLRATVLSWAMDPKKNAEARSEAARALELDPENARAHAMVAFSWINDTGNAWSDPKAALENAREHALAGVAADDRDPWAHAMLGLVYQWRDRAQNKALAELTRAFELNPASAYFRSLRAFAMIYAGQSEAGLAELDASMRLNPIHPPIYPFFYGRGLFNLRRYDEALPYLQRARTEMPGHTNALALAAACHAALDRLEEAREVVEDVLKISPDYTLSHVRAVLPFALDDERDHLLAMLKKAGLPE